MKRIIQIASVSVIGIMTLYVLVAANGILQEQRMLPPKIHLNVQKGITLLTKDELLEELYTARLFRDSMKKEDLDIKKIEDYINNMDEVFSSEVYCDIDNNWHINVTTKRPIVRVVRNNQEDFYINYDGRIAQLSPYARPRILPFIGMDQLLDTKLPLNKIINNDSLKTKLKLNQLYRISKYVCNDEFYNAQIVQIQYTKNDEFILTPKVGGQRIIFGSAKTDEMVKKKFKKLSIFYREVIPYEGWQKYESINLKFKNQIVAKKN